MDPLLQHRVVVAIEAKFEEIAGRAFEYLARNLVDQAEGQAVAEFRKALGELVEARAAALGAVNEEAT